MPAPEQPIEKAEALLCRGWEGKRSVVSVARPTRLVLDFGREMSGPLEIQFGGGSGTVEVSYSESLRYLGPSCDDLGIEGFAAPARYYVPPCPRQIALHSGELRWRDTHPRSGFRYVLLTIHPQPGRIVHVRSARVVGYAPLPQFRRLSARSVYRGWFLSSAPALDEYWFDGAYTAQVDTLAAGRVGLFYEGIPGLSPTEPVIVDGAKRDRYIWYDLAGPKELVPLLYGDRRTPQDTLAALAEEQTQAGFIPACRDTGSFYGAPCASAWTDASGWWVIALGEFWHWTGDRAFIASMYPKVRRALAALASCEKAGGLIQACNGAATYDGGEPPGATTYLNAVYYEALRSAAALAEAVRRGGEAAADERESDALRSRINATLWDPGVGAYVCSTADRACHSQDANVLTALWGIAGRVRAVAALRYVRLHLWTPVGTRTGSPGLENLVANWISYFEMQARLRYGDTAEVRQMLGAAWGYMNGAWKKIKGPLGETEEPPSTTDWEHIVAPTGDPFRGPEGSMSHVWSAGATVIETTGLLGIQPLAPGFAQWQIAPHVAGSGLTWAEGQVPCHGGLLAVAWSIRVDKPHPRRFVLHVSAPKGTIGTVHIPLLGPSAAVREDGNPVSGPRIRGAVVVPGVKGNHTFVVTR